MRDIFWHKYLCPIVSPHDERQPDLGLLGKVASSVTNARVTSNLVRKAGRDFLDHDFRDRHMGGPSRPSLSIVACVSVLDASSGNCKGNWAD
jgi:hypothetical protein